MRFKYWLKSLLSTSACRRRVRRSSPGVRLSLEAMEDRLTPSYTVVDLGTLGGTFSDAADLNNSAQVTAGTMPHMLMRSFRQV